jgi:uncharacterized OB-fold protein
MMELLVPLVLDEAAGFWQLCQTGVLSVQACQDCGLRRFPPCPMCSRCQSLRRSWVPVSGVGAIWSFAVPHPPLLPAYQDLAPFVVAVVELADQPGLRMVGNVLAREGGAINEVRERDIQIGHNVRVTFEPRGDLHIPQWVLAS